MSGDVADAIFDCLRKKKVTDTMSNIVLQRPFRFEPVNNVARAVLFVYVSFLLCVKADTTCADQLSSEGEPNDDHASRVGGIRRRA